MRIEFDLQLSGVDHHVDTDTMLLSQFSAIELATGLTFKPLFQGIVNDEPRAIRALAWLLRGCSEDYGAIDFPMSDWKVTNMTVTQDGETPKEPAQPRLESVG